MSLGGRITGGWHTVEAFGVRMKMCFAYFDDKLFLAFLPGSEYRKVNDKLKAVLQEKYGKGSTYGGGHVFITDWFVGGKLKINKVTSLVSSLTYTYAPLKSLQLKAGIPAYQEAERKIANTGKSKF